MREIDTRKVVRAERARAKLRSRHSERAKLDRPN